MRAAVHQDRIYSSELVSMPAASRSVGRSSSPVAAAASGVRLSLSIPQADLMGHWSRIDSNDAAFSTVAGYQQQQQ